MKKLTLILGSCLLLVACNNSTPQETPTPVPSEQTEPAQNESQTKEMDSQDMEANLLTRETFEVEKTELSFKGVALGGVMKHEGTLATTVTITPSETTPVDFTQAKVSAKVDLKSLGTGSGMLTDHLMSADFFGVESHPEAMFESSSITKNEDGTYSVMGTLTLKGVSKEITLENVKVTNEGIEAEYELNLNDFGVVAEGNDKVEPKTPVMVVVTFK